MVRRGGDDECWPWTGAVTKDGLGKVYTWRGSELAHRIAWVLLRGDLPALITLRRRCTTDSCVNPSHHDWTRLVHRNRAKLTADQVRAIRAAAARGESAKAIARRFSVSRDHIYAVVNRLQWRDVA